MSSRLRESQPMYNKIELNMNINNKKTKIYYEETEEIDYCYPFRKYLTQKIQIY
jgi:hypothetical protein